VVPGKLSFDLSASGARNILKLIARCERDGANFEMVEITLGKKPTCVVGKHRLELEPACDPFPRSWRKVLAIRPTTQHTKTAFSADYLAAVAKSLPGRTADDNAVFVQARGHTDPVRFDGSVGEFPAYVILMPRREW
jgi:hypothetical protein